MTFEARNYKIDLQFLLNFEDDAYLSWHNLRFVKRIFDDLILVNEAFRKDFV